MKVLIIFVQISLLLFSCKDNEEPTPSATGTYTGTYTGYVSPTAIAGTCKGDIVEKDSKITGTLVFSPNIFSGLAGTFSSLPISGTLKMMGDTGYAVNGTISVGSGVGDIPFAGTVSKDKKTTEMSCNPAPVFNLKWSLKKE